MPAYHQKIDWTDGRLYWGRLKDAKGPPSLTGYEIVNGSPKGRADVQLKSGDVVFRVYPMQLIRDVIGDVLAEVS